MDLEKSINRRNQRSEFLSTVLTNQSAVTTVETLHPDHPMNHVTDILHKLESSVYRHRRRRRKRGGPSEDGCQSETVVYGPFERSAYENEKQSEISETSQATPETKDPDIQSSNVNPDNIDGQMTTDPSGPGGSSAKEPSLAVICEKNSSQNQDALRILSKKIEPIPKEVIVKYRLKEAQIRAIPRFENYSAGTPNNVSM